MHTEASAFLHAGDGIRIAQPHGELSFALYLGRLGGITLYADREQLTRLRDAITTALDEGVTP